MEENESILTIYDLSFSQTIPSIESELYNRFFKDINQYHNVSYIMTMIPFLIIIVGICLMISTDTIRIITSFIHFHISIFYNKQNNLNKSNHLNPVMKLPIHIAVIMDGNRRYGKLKYNNPTKGHKDGSKTLVNFVDWCIKYNIKILTVYAFSTENWNRSEVEINVLMDIFNQFMDKIGPEAKNKNIKINILSSNRDKFNDTIKKSIKDIENNTKDCNSLILNICVSYGAREEILNICTNIAKQIENGELSSKDINENIIRNNLLTKNLPDPDILIRTSGEFRLSNFLLYQSAYTELLFINKLWPEITEIDFKNVLNQYQYRKRRFGK